MQRYPNTVILYRWGVTGKLQSGWALQEYRLIALLKQALKLAYFSLRFVPLGREIIRSVA
jgi:hypothetical protein